MNHRVTKLPRKKLQQSGYKEEIFDFGGLTFKDFLHEIVHDIVMTACNPSMNPLMPSRPCMESATATILMGFDMQANQSQNLHPCDLKRGIQDA